MCREQAAKVSPFVPPLLMCCYQLTMAEEEIINNTLVDWTAATRFNIYTEYVRSGHFELIDGDPGEMKRSVLNISNEHQPTHDARAPNRT